MDKNVEQIIKRAQYHVAKHKEAVRPDPARGYIGLERYPEFEPLVKEVVQLAIRAIQDKADAIQSEMPYKQQFVLEEVINKLKDLV